MTATESSDPAPDGVDATRLSELRSHPDVPLLGPLTGTWSRSIADDAWYWSDEMYVIHGFSPGDVVPTSELVLRHKHPTDLERSTRLFHTATEYGTPFSNWHRILDARGRTRHVLTVGRGLTDAEGRLVEVTGFMVDLTETRRRDVQPAIEEALRGAMEHRGAIEQAKGILMVAFQLDAEGAFRLLRNLSTTHNLKLRDLAHRIVAEMPQVGLSAESVAAAEDLLARVTGRGHLAD